MKQSGLIVSFILTGTKGYPFFCQLNIKPLDYPTRSFLCHVLGLCWSTACSSDSPPPFFPLPHICATETSDSTKYRHSKASSLVQFQYPAVQVYSGPILWVCQNHSESSNDRDNVSSPTALTMTILSRILLLEPHQSGHF
jgi:hypothetical protein